jgi:hypothetical protein
MMIELDVTLILIGLGRILLVEFTLTLVLIGPL